MSREKRQTGELQTTATDEASAFAARRRVIKGLASTVPVALTLSNGAAMAAVSSHQCLTQQDPGTEPRCSDADNPDDLDSDWVWSGDPITPPANEVPASQSPKYCVEYAVEEPIGTLETTGYNYDYLDGNTPSQVFVNQDGTTVDGGQVGNPLTASCGGSFI